MHRCTHCGADLAAQAMTCPSCHQPTPHARVRALAAKRRSGAQSTLAGAPGPRPTPLEDATVPEGTLERIAALASHALDDATILDESLPDTLPPERVARLSSGGGILAADQGQPARRASTPPVPPLKPGLLAPGEVVEGYRVESEVGRGGMGRVYKAVHAVTGQSVALKMLLPELLDDARLKARFVNEAQVLARFDHPNLVPLLGFFDSPRGAFIAMPFVEGITLEKMLRKQGRLDLEAARDLVSQIASGLGAIHRKGVMHRDLKPSNILVRSDGRVRITDFGIARAIGAERITRAGMVVGTAEYLAPEQASGATHDDLRSEIYALAVLAYEMVTGRVPFRHPNAAQVLIKHVRSVPPPPSTVRPDLPKAVEAVILRGLAKNPADRHETPLAFAEAFEAAFDTPNEAARPFVPTPAGPIPGVESAPTNPIEPVAGRRRKPRSAAALVAQIVIGAALGAGLAAGAWYLLTRS